MFRERVWEGMEAIYYVQVEHNLQTIHVDKTPLLEEGPRGNVPALRFGNISGILHRTQNPKGPQRIRGYERNHLSEALVASLPHWFPEKYPKKTENAQHDVQVEHPNTMGSTSPCCSKCGLNKSMFAKAQRDQGKGVGILS